MKNHPSHYQSCIYDTCTSMTTGGISSEDWLPEQPGMEGIIYSIDLTIHEIGNNYRVLTTFTIYNKQGMVIKHLHRENHYNSSNFVYFMERQINFFETYILSSSLSR